MARRCPKCGFSLDRHDYAGQVDCAYRGRACRSCGHPPHRDGVWNCDTYSHPDDTYREHDLRELNLRPSFLEQVFDDPLAGQPGYQRVLDAYHNYVAGKRDGSESPAKALA